jgi:dTDP-4-dehydrorhamnose reductase
LADVCARAGLPFMTFTSDWVFDGTQCRPYVESDHVSPIELCGANQASAEQRVLSQHPRALIIRTSDLFGWSEKDEIRDTLMQLDAGNHVILSSESITARTYVPHLVTACLDLFLDGASGVWHLANVGQASLRELLEQLMHELGLSTGVLERSCDETSKVRPVRHAVLSSERGTIMPSLEAAIEAYARQYASG